MARVLQESGSATSSPACSCLSGLVRISSLYWGKDFSPEAVRFNKMSIEDSEDSSDGSKDVVQDVEDSDGSCEESKEVVKDVEDRDRSDEESKKIVPESPTEDVQASTTPPVQSESAMQHLTEEDFAVFLDEELQLTPTETCKNGRSSARGSYKTAIFQEGFRILFGVF
ncbi:Hypothetical predicted protein [Olea europaea subsp. europaea]|uniref:Uncharacterized protein n=1 Tax=Olea europaea subsp. europaea TaxID=158383 RepID=A0A8S0RCU4_OLEEU|nr:Hypothetical predicted protein [Olea europaea subsp. europaea]